MAIQESRFPKKGWKQLNFFLKKKSILLALKKHHYSPLGEPFHLIKKGENDVDLEKRAVSKMTPFFGTPVELSTGLVHPLNIRVSGIDIHSYSNQ